MDLLRSGVSTCTCGWGADRMGSARLAAAAGVSRWSWTCLLLWGVEGEREGGQGGGGSMGDGKGKRARDKEGRLASAGGGREGLAEPRIGRREGGVTLKG
jgi:hypothetical protein